MQCSVCIPYPKITKGAQHVKDYELIVKNQVNMI
jgi:hypothetical protein